MLTLAGRFLLKISNISPFIFNTLQFSSVLEQREGSLLQFCIGAEGGEGVFVTLAVGIFGLEEYL